ncbi:Na+/H+ antiporter NhaC [Lentibacillus sp. L22]|uniref:Na+/H+ antiporter NhaC n=1 Tax=Lentibacillus TaxID=175304 RepID=UPI0022B1BE14|nr:Na+/H+ antiporter NhaC [Lentibacillus daqui]
MKEKIKRKPSLMEALSSVIVLLVIFFFGTLADLPAPALIAIAVAYLIFIGWRCGYTWKEMEEYTAGKIKSAIPAMSILIAVGFLLGSWMFSGTIPMFIYYGVQLVSEQWILASAFILCAVFSMSTGTAWGSAATAGITMMGIAMGMPNVNVAAVAGACYTGAIFGDKLSPLSDTTILAALSTKNDIFDHIKHMTKTVIPAAILGLIIYIVMGINASATGHGLPDETLHLLDTLNTAYDWNIVVLIPLFIVIYGAIRKKPSTVMMVLSSIVAILIGIFYQGYALVDGVIALYDGFDLSMIESANPAFIASDAGAGATELLNRGGLASMLQAFIVIYICFYFAGVMEQIGALEVLLGKLFESIKTRFGLIFATSISVVFLVAVGGSSTLALILTGEMYSDKFKKMGYSTLNLSRTMEDFGTGFAGFVPWSGSGVYYPAVFGVPIISYLPYAFMSYFIWIIAYLYAFTGISIKPLENKTNKHILENKIDDQDFKSKVN